MLVQESQDILKLYANSFKSKVTARSYTFYLKKFNTDLVSLTKLTQKEAEDKIIQFIISKKDNGVRWGPLHLYVAALCKFYIVICDTELNKNRINRFMPEHVKSIKDRGYKVEEIKTMLELANERTGAVILLLSSTGIRFGAVPILKVGDLDDKGDIYKVTVYSNTKQEYCTYCSPEAKEALLLYFKIRERHGETIDNKSPVIREQYNKINPLTCKYAKSTSKGALRFILEEIMERAGLRARVSKVPYSSTLKEVKLAHGFRKFFNTQLVSSRINPLIKEMLMGHSVGLEANYYRPTDEDIEAEYYKAIDYLTISNEKRLKRKVEMLTIEKSKVDLALSQIEEMKKKIGLD